jgi:inward rectifier potassium channel
MIYAALTTIFAVIYWLMPGPISTQDLSNFRNAMFFSFEVLSTSGYSGMPPDAVLAKLIATVEIVLGLAFIAIMMGLVFVRFSRAKARLVFADKVVVAMHNGKPTLMVRIGNGRAHAMTDTSASLNLLIKEPTLEGNEFYNVYDLPLTRPYTPYFPLIMTLMHVIDDKSALKGFTDDTVLSKGIMLFLSFETRDPLLADTVNALRTYAPSQIAFGARYVDAISTGEDGRPVADLGKISLIEPDAAWK